MTNALKLGSIMLFSASVGACGGSDEATDSPTDSGGGSDTGSAFDSTAGDSAKPDTTPADGGVDTAVADTAVADTTVADTAPADSGVDTALEVGDGGCLIPAYGTVPGTIYYSRLATVASGEGEIWTVKGDGTADTKLTNGEWPRLSHDGKYMAFHRDNGGPARASLYVRDMTSGVETKVYDNPDNVVGVTWAADDAKLYFDSACSILSANRDGTGVTTLLGTDCYNDCPDLRPSDSLIAFHNVHSKMFTMSSAGAAVTAIPSTVAGDVWPHWSPSGSKLAFLHVVTETDPAGNLGIINADGTGRTVLTTLTLTDGFRTSGSWTADGTTIVNAGFVCGISGLWAVSASTGAITRLRTSTSTTMPVVDWVGDVR